MTNENTDSPDPSDKAAARFSGAGKGNDHINKFMIVHNAQGSAIYNYLLWMTKDPETSRVIDEEMMIEVVLEGKDEDIMKPLEDRPCSSDFINDIQAIKKVWNQLKKRNHHASPLEAFKKRMAGPLFRVSKICRSNGIKILMCLYSER